MRIGLYPGTFDPLTFGHIDIIRRASGLVDRLVVGVAANRDKKPLFSVEERANMIKTQVKRLSKNLKSEILICEFDKLLICD